MLAPGKAGETKGMGHDEGELELSTDPRRLDLDRVHRFLAEESYWARDLPRAVLEVAVANSLCFGLYRGGRQVAFARVVTDRATYGYVCDLFVFDDERGKGLGKCLMGAILRHPELQGFRRWGLATNDAHGLYAQFGFQPLARPERMMEITDPEVYRRRQ